MAAALGYGSLIKIGDSASPEQFTAVAKITSLNGISLTKDSPEITNTASTGRAREYIVGLLDGGTIDFEFISLPNDTSQSGTNAKGLAYHILNDTALRNFQLYINSTTPVTWTVSGIITNFSLSAVPSEAQTGSASIKVSGKPTLV